MPPDQDEPAGRPHLVLGPRPVGDLAIAGRNVRGGMVCFEAVLQPAIRVFLEMHQFFATALQLIPDISG